MMTYSNKFVMCVLVNGQPQKELANGTVSIPFGEYSLRFRNKNNRRAVVKIYIDGENVSGGGYVIQANSHVDIKRHHDVDRAFKFVSLDSAEAVDHGKNGPNPDKVKGTIEAHFYLEKERPQVIYRDVHHHHHHEHIYKPRPPWQPHEPWIKPCVQPYWATNTSSGEYSAAYGATIESKGPSAQSSNSIRACSLGMSAQPTMDMCEPTSFNLGDKSLQDGCTVEGYSTGQNFYSTWVDTEDEATVLKLFLQGYQPLEDTATVQKRPTNKDHRIDDLEAENEELRRKIAEIENAKLKQQLESLQK